MARDKMKKKVVGDDVRSPLRKRAAEDDSSRPRLQALLRAPVPLIYFRSLGYTLHERYLVMASPASGRYYPRAVDRPGSVLFCTAARAVLGFDRT